MKLSDLARLIDISLTNPPPINIAQICGEHYHPYYYLLNLLAANRHIKLGQAVELGTEKGRGLEALASGGIRQVVGIDHNRRPEIDGLLDHHHNLTFLEMSSIPVPDEIEGPIDILHIDTEHSQAQAREEFNAYKPYLNSPAVVLFDDLHAEEEGVLRFFAGQPYPKVQDDRLHPSCGYGVMLFS